MMLTLGFILIGTFALASQSPCEAGANAAYNTIYESTGSTTLAQQAYDASLSACEKKLKETGWD